MSNFDAFSELKVGDKIDNKQLCQIFQCGLQGGMRKSNKTNSLVLVSDQTQKANKNPYKDIWVDGLLHYTGMGLKGDQSIHFAQNKTLANLDKNNVRAFLFEKIEPKLYTFKGEVVLGGEVYYETQEDNEGNKRQVIKFPLIIKK